MNPYNLIDMEGTHVEKDQRSSTYLLNIETYIEEMMVPRSRAPNVSLRSREDMVG